jgi:hypothetical protein
VACLDVRAQNLEKKILEILSTQDGKKTLEIDYKNLEISEICTDEKSRDLHFLRNINLRKIYLYDGPKACPMLKKSRELFFSRFTFLELFPPMLPKTREKKSRVFLLEIIWGCLQKQIVKLISSFYSRISFLKLFLLSFTSMRNLKVFCEEF